MDLYNLLPISKELNILYIEDDICKDSTTIFLSELFKTVTIAKDGLEGLCKYKDYYEQNNEYFDIIISDVNMPNMDGIELSKNILEINEKQILVIISAYNDSKNLIELLNLGVTSFIQKPINFNSIIRIMTKICHNIYNSNMVIEFNNKIKELNKDLVDSNLLLEKKVSERTSELENLLYFDKLTSLGSHYSLMKDLEQSSSAVLFIVNLDSFHNINNLYGFESSNTLLIQFSQCLKMFNYKYGYKLYRVYADEFVMYKEIEDNNFDIYEKMLFDLTNAIKQYEFVINEDESIDLNASIGLSLCNENPMMSASVALRHAKKHRVSFFVYNKELDSSQVSINVLKWSLRLKKAIEEKLILTAYQPIVDRNGDTVKYEVLMRVAEKYNDTYNIIGPYEFLEPALKTKKYNEMMAILIEKSFITMYNKKEDFSINLSYEDIYNRTLINIIKENLRKFRKIGNRLIIEILETESIEDLEIMQEFIKEVREFGVRIAIDDFGTGHSNFSNIIAIDPDYIKIDGSFIKNIHIDSKAYTLVKGIIVSSKELNIKTIAEFVHNKEIFDILLDLGVDEFQGYYFSEPLLNI